MSKHYSSEFKSKVALISLREEMPTSELSKTYGVPSGVINRWRREALEILAQCFSSKKEMALTEAQGRIENLERKIGQLRYRPLLLSSIPFKISGCYYICIRVLSGKNTGT